MLTAALRRATLVNRHGLAVVQGEERRTWQDTVARIASMAALLRRHGVQPGTHVATLALNSPACFELLLAVWWAGGVIVPLNTRLAGPELLQLIAHSQARVLVADAAFSEVVRQAEAEVEALGACPVLEGLVQQAAQGRVTMDDACQGLGERAAIFYTGGTTGQPKGVELTHANIAFAALGMQRDLRQDDRTVYLHAAPLFHLADFGIGLGTTLACGAHSFLDRFTPAAFYQRLREDGVTHLQLVPTMLAAVLEATERDDRLLAQVRSVSYGAAPIGAALLSRLRQAFPNARLQQFYGMTECSGASVMLPDEAHGGPGRIDKLHTAGRPIIGFELRIADAEGRACAVGSAGEIQVRGPAVTRGYWQDAQRTAEAFTTDGWLRTGDAGVLDDAGFVQVVDRLKDMIISGGENVYGAEVERVLGLHASVRACAVLGLPDERWGERVHAVVVPHPGQPVDAAVLDRHCRSLIAGYKVPRSYEVRPEGLPLSALGKVQKHVLREQALAAMTSRPER